MQERRLADIMPALRSFSRGGFIDIVGYTTLNGMDKDQPFQLLRKNCKIQKTIFEKYRGEWLKRCIDKRESLLRFLTICPTKSHHILDEQRLKELMNKSGIEEYKADFKRDQKVGYNPI